MPKPVAEQVAHYAVDHPYVRIAMVAERYSLARDRMVVPLLALEPSYRPLQFDRDWLQVIWVNGSKGLIYIDPARLRLTHHDAAWLLDIAADSSLYRDVKATLAADAPIWAD